MPRKTKPLTPAKLRLVQVARKKLMLSDADYRAILARVAGASSSRDLSDENFRHLMDEFARLGFQSDSATRNLGRRPGFATAGQIANIRKLWCNYTDGQGTESQLGHWLERTWKISALRFLPEDKAKNAIVVLRGMIARKAAKHDG
ncbi:hypothetical protein AA0242T_2702 [Acetobacter aceti NRIC 0242]|uniref:Regulatory protein GemA n=1 Tax=Acetobacter aceti NBRC 14818 TaxID=887700 RepID=A0AB33IMS4_ACEAC|nr:regulatory protein GemA [Acetobacter aceti]TCS27248.1 uncharacterized protein DUF1018 [Acetobacter aceti NBRC 14818]BCK77769.1 hypothetical protein EMQ_P213 [Acetobacter aceti NBRC 14818]GBO82000.1 hypothetical protein AA0242T_2702 [Acetobacter aceti NRIC 0242]